MGENGSLTKGQEQRIRSLERRQHAFLVGVAAILVSVPVTVFGLEPFSNFKAGNEISAEDFNQRFDAIVQAVSDLEDVPPPLLSGYCGVTESGTGARGGYVGVRAECAK